MSIETRHKVRVDISGGCTLNELVDELNKLKGQGYGAGKVSFGCSLLPPTGPHDNPYVRDEFWLEVGDR